MDSPAAMAGVRKATSSGRGTPSRVKRQSATPSESPSLVMLTATATAPAAAPAPAAVTCAEKGPASVTARRARTKKPDDAQHDAAEDRGVHLRGARAAELLGVVLVTEADTGRRLLAAAEAVVDRLPVGRGGQEPVVSRGGRFGWSCHGRQTSARAGGALSTTGRRGGHTPAPSPAPSRSIGQPARARMSSSSSGWTSWTMSSAAPRSRQRPSARPGRRRASSTLTATRMGTSSALRPTAASSASKTGRSASKLSLKQVQASPWRAASRAPVRASCRRR